ncbi:hypothetical protein K1719_043297 [Acacia pycnantha]|nr:hypothetical protein K1719_043297 [Acacia pycnantha]
MSSLLSILTLLFIVIVVGFSQAEETLISSQPQQKDSNDNCSYHLNIETSCFSPHTQGTTSVLFSETNMAMRFMFRDWMNFLRQHWDVVL